MKEEHSSRVKVSNFLMLMSELFLEKLWIMQHRHDVEEYIEKTNGYRRVFAVINEYFKDKGSQSLFAASCFLELMALSFPDASVYRAREADFSEKEFFEILEYWSLKEVTLHISNEAPKYKDIDEEEELNYDSSASSLEYFVSRGLAATAASEKTSRDIETAVQKYSKILREADSEVERSAVKKILLSLKAERRKEGRWWVKGDIQPLSLQGC